MNVDSQLVGCWGEDCAKRYWESRKDGMWDVQRAFDRFNSTHDLDAVMFDVDRRPVQRAYIQVKATLYHTTPREGLITLRKYLKFANALGPREAFFYAWISLPLQRGFLFGAQYLTNEMNATEAAFALHAWADDRISLVPLQVECARMSFRLTDDEIQKAMNIGRRQQTSASAELPIDASE